MQEWVSLNQMSINWSKTKFMILTNKRIDLPVNIVNTQGNIVKEFFGFTFEYMNEIAFI